MKKVHTKYWKGAFEGYSDFRYGRPSSVWVPGQPLPKQAVDPNAKAHMIERTIDVLRSGKASVFEHEGDCRHGLRSALCLRGAPWPTADGVAAYAVAEALKEIGAKRPTWEEGQREATIPDDCCAWCGGEIEQVGTRRDRYCSIECAKLAWTRRDAEDRKSKSAMHMRAFKIINRERQPDCTCEKCGKAYKPPNPNAPGRYCSTACAAAARTYIEERPCLHCGTVFKPKQSANKGKDVGLYCSKACYSAAGRRAQFPKSCECCGSAFMARSSRAKFCTPECANFVSHLEHRGPPRQLSRLAFDHLVTMPANAGRPPWLTAARFDEMVAA